VSKTNKRLLLTMALVLMSGYGMMPVAVMWLNRWAGDGMIATQFQPWAYPLIGTMCFLSGIIARMWWEEIQ
jgi:hypothetical protein